MISFLKDMIIYNQANDYIESSLPIEGCYARTLQYDKWL